MRNLTPTSITQAFADYAKNAPSERTRTLLVSLAGHLHMGYSGDVRTHHEAVKRSILSVQAGTATSHRARALLDPGGGARQPCTASPACRPIVVA